MNMNIKKVMNVVKSNVVLAAGMTVEATKSATRVAAAGTAVGIVIGAEKVANATCNMSMAMDAKANKFGEWLLAR